MSLYDYNDCLGINRDDPPFYALIMAAMLRADTGNADRLKAAFPETWAELDRRYNAPGGRLPEDEAS